MANNDNENKGIGRFLDWVNANQDLPSLEELEHEHEHEDHGHGDEHGGHDEGHEGHGEDSHEEPAHVSDHADMSASDAEEPTAEYEVFTEDDEMVYPDPVVSNAEAAPQADAAPAPAPEAAAPKRPVQITREQRKRLSWAQILYGMLASLLAITIIAVLLITASQLPEFGSAGNPTINEVYDKYVDEGVKDTGAINLVAGMILDYRAFDTLGESLMLFTATMGVIMLIRRPKSSSKSGEARKEGEE